MKEYYLYESSDLPDGGWIQSCITCTIPTFNIILYRELKKKKIYSYLCKNCDKKCRTNTKFNNGYNHFCIELELELELMLKTGKLCCLDTC